MCTQKLNRIRERERYSARLKCFYCVERNDEFSFFFAQFRTTIMDVTFPDSACLLTPNPPGLQPTSTWWWFIQFVLWSVNVLFACCLLPSLLAVIRFGFCSSIAAEARCENLATNHGSHVVLSSLISPSSHLHAPSAHLPLNVFRNCC